MDVIRILWAFNFFFFLLVLIFLWSKTYLIAGKVNDVLSLIKQCDEIPHESAKTAQKAKA